MPAERTYIHRFMVNLPERLYESLRALAEAEERTLGEVVREAIRRYIHSRGREEG